MDVADRLLPGALEAHDRLAEDVTSNGLGDVLRELAAIGVHVQVVLPRVTEGHPPLTAELRGHPLLPEPVVADRPPGGQVEAAGVTVDLDADAPRADLSPAQEGTVERPPQVHDVRVGSAPLVDQVLQVVPVALCAHVLQRLDAAVVAERQRGDLALEPALERGVPVEVEHSRSGLDVDVAARMERLERPVLSRQPRHDSGLDGGVVHHGERPDQRRPHQPLERLRVDARAHRQVEACGVLGGDGLELRTGQVVELDAPTRPAARVRAEEAELPPEASVLRGVPQDRQVLAGGGQGQLLPQLQHATLVVGQVSLSEEPLDGVRRQIGDGEARPLDPGGQLLQGVGVLHASDLHDLQLLLELVHLSGLHRRLGHLQIRLDADVVEDLVRLPRGQLLLRLLRQAVERLLQNGDVLLAVVDELLPLLRLLLRRGEAPVPVRRAEQVDQPGACGVLDVGAQRTGHPVEGLRVARLGGAGHGVDPPERLDVLPRREAELSAHADALELGVVRDEGVLLVGEEREELLLDLLLPHGDADGAIVHRPGDHQDLEGGRLGVSVDVGLLEVDIGFRLNVEEKVGHREPLLLLMCARLSADW